MIIDKIILHTYQIQTHVKISSSFQVVKVKIPQLGPYIPLNRLVTSANNNLLSLHTLNKFDKTDGVVLGWLWLGHYGYVFGSGKYAI